MQPSESGRRGAEALYRKNPSADDRRAITARARDAFWAMFLNSVDPHGKLPVAQRIARAHEARSDYYRKLVGRRWAKRAQQQVAT